MELSMFKGMEGMFHKPIADFKLILEDMRDAWKKTEAKGDALEARLVRIEDKLDQLISHYLAQIEAEVKNG